MNLDTRERPPDAEICQPNGLCRHVQSQQLGLAPSGKSPAIVSMPPFPSSLRAIAGGSLPFASFQIMPPTPRLSRAPRGFPMSDQSEVGTVLSHAPRLERAFGRKLAVVITLAGLYFTRRRPGLAGLLASMGMTIGLVLFAWIKVAYR